jgi:hypothetical protein
MLVPSLLRSSFLLAAACVYACAADPNDTADGALGTSPGASVTGDAIGGASNGQAINAGAGTSGAPGALLAGRGGSPGSAGQAGAAISGAGGAAGEDPRAGSGGSGTAGMPACGGEDTCDVPGGGLLIDCAKRFYYGINYAWSRDNFGRDFGGLAAWGGGGVASQRAQRLAEMQDMREHGVDVVRWWVFPDFRGDGVTFDSAGMPTGLGGTLAADVAAALEIAAEAGIYVEFTLFSFDAFRPATTLDGGVQVPSIAPLVMDEAARTALIELVVGAFVDEVSASANARRMLAWDVINEPEWATAGSDGIDQPFDPMPPESIEAVPYEVMRDFIAEAVAAIHARSDRPVTVGGAAIKWAKAWADVGLDYYTFHMYDWVHQSFPYTRPLADYGVTDKPVVLGEFPLKGLTGVSYAQLVSGIFDLGYAGALGWAVTDDAQGPWSATKAEVKTFADTTGCAVRR